MPALLIVVGWVLFFNAPRTEAASCFCWSDRDCSTPSCGGGSTCKFTWWFGVGSCADPAPPPPPTHLRPVSPPTRAPTSARSTNCKCESDADCRNSPSCPNDCVFPPWGAFFGTCLSTDPAPPPSPRVPPPASRSPIPPTPTHPPIPPPSARPTPNPTIGPVVLPPPTPNGGSSTIGTGRGGIPNKCHVSTLISFMERAVRLNKVLAPQWLRLAFHDAGTFDKRSSTGGANGCLLNSIEMRKQEENLNMDIAIETLQTVGDVWGQSTAADLIQFAGFFAAIRQRGVPGLTAEKRVELIESFEWGRADETQCDIAWTHNLPAFELGTEPVTDVARRCQMAGAEIRTKMMERNGFSAFEATALIGAHTIGLTRHVFGKDDAGPWNNNGGDDATVNGPVFDNEFFTFLIDNVEARTIHEFVDNRRPFDIDFPTWYRFNESNINHLDTDMVLAFPSPDTTIHPNYHTFSALFASNNDFFVRSFMASLHKMSRLGIQRPLQKASPCNAESPPNNNNQRDFPIQDGPFIVDPELAMGSPRLPPPQDFPIQDGPFIVDPELALGGAPIRKNTTSMDFSAFEELIRQSLRRADVLIENTAVERAEDIEFLTTPIH